MSQYIHYFKDLWYHKDGEPLDYQKMSFQGTQLKKSRMICTIIDDETRWLNNVLH
jgi:hypothetical protein